MESTIGTRFPRTLVAAGYLLISSCIYGIMNGKKLRHWKRRTD